MLQLSKEICIGLMLLFSTQFLHGEDIRVGKTSLKISTGCALVFKNDLSVENDALIRNNGSVYINNDQVCTLRLNTILNGDGIYNLTGNDDCIITGDGAGISSLYVANSNFVNITTNLTISGVLSLNAGIVDVADGYQLKLMDTSPGTIIFDDNYYNTSFIEGTLVRNTEAGNEYFFPVGSVTDGFHPLKIRDLSSSGYLTVNYNPDYDEDWNAGNTQVTLESLGAWQVETESEGITFVPSLSLYNTTTGILSDLYNMFYTPDVEISSDFSIDYNSLTDSYGYLEGQSSYMAGLFAVSKVETIINEEGEPIPEMVNFLVKDGGGRTTFDVPGIDNYKKVELTVYNRFGNLVYRSTNYANDFDCKDYRTGTYFYELSLLTQDNRNVLSRNIIEIMEHK